MQMMIKKEKITINKIVCINSNNCKRNNQTSKKNQITYLLKMIEKEYKNLKLKSNQKILIKKFNYLDKEQFT